MVLVVGVGNRDRGDDGIGSLIAERLIKEGFENVLDCERTLENYLFKIIEKKPKKIFFIDACDFGGKIGEIKVFRKEEWQNFKRFALSTHTLPLPVLFSLIEKLTNSEIYLLGIQVKDTGFSHSLSKELNNLFEEIIGKVKVILKGRQ
ncbi:MAG: hydrogenase maturation protease [candidate division WOR-3 bacterium]|nr:hydrogenase maturation protease [candidate division WOR-3 bacterium]MCX7837683.1 hydrogenase maturation protease [candidate division WOR-3 bacterium]MDW8113414.1 hydrogenase maturation protease [candidate division WOR-3 bacterium]